MKKIYKLIALITVALGLLAFACCDASNANDTVYTVTLELGEVSGNTKAQISKNSIDVKYGDNLKLVTPSCDGYEFLYWVIKGTDTVVSDGLYRYKEDLILVAIWKNSWSERG